MNPCPHRDIGSMQDQETKLYEWRCLACDAVVDLPPETTFRITKAGFGTDMRPLPEPIEVTCDPRKLVTITAQRTTPPKAKK